MSAPKGDVEVSPLTSFDGARTVDALVAMRSKLGGFSGKSVPRGFVTEQRESHPAKALTPTDSGATKASQPHGTLSPTEEAELSHRYQYVEQPSSPTGHHSIAILQYNIKSSLVRCCLS